MTTIEDSTTDTAGDYDLLSVDTWLDPERWPGIDKQPLPSWVTSIRQSQAEAIAEIMYHYRHGGPKGTGTKLVVLDAPTGTGKTLLGEGVRRGVAAMLAGHKGLYVCHGLALQDQFIGDFPYGKLLKGRANYRTEYGGDDVTCADCDDPTGDNCSWCSGKQTCPYQIAKAEAMRHPLAVVNTAFLLAEANNVAEAVSRRQFTVMDECDTMESILLGFCELRISGRWLTRFGMEAPIKAARKTTIIPWLRRVEEAAKRFSVGAKDKRDKVAAMRLAQQTAWCAMQLEIDAQAGDGDDQGAWLRVYPEQRDRDQGAFIMQPVLVAPYGPSMLWAHSTRWLAMSGTVVSADEFAQSLGWHDDYAAISVPMSFPVENRPIVLAGVANVIRAEMQDAVPKLAKAIVNIAALHPNDRILVHTVSYQLAKDLRDRVQPEIGRRRTWTYANAQEKDAAVAGYRRDKGSIIFAPSLDRGVDFRDDDCRVQVIAKVPFPNLGDRRTAARMHLPGGQWWYQVQTVRTIMQMTGRGVRSEDDHAVTYVIDKQFAGNLFSGPGKRLFPQWWRDAIDRSFNARQLLAE